MATAVKATTTELGDSRVRVEVEVPPEALERELESAASALGRDMRVPGFRQGKVPPAVVIRQVGRDAVLDEAVRRALPGWYEQALQEAGVATVGDPKVDLTDLPEKGAPLAFTIEVAIVPEAKLADYKGVEVGKREPEVSDEELEAELERLRESLASLETVERPAADGDFAVVDFVGRIDGEPFEGGEARGYLLELGSGRLIPGFEEQLTGAEAGEQRDVNVSFPDDYQADHLAGKEAVFAVEVKEIKEKRLPELDDDFAVESGGYDSLDELREELAGRLREVEERTIEGEFRQAAVDAVVADATLEGSPRARAREGARDVAPHLPPALRPGHRPEPVPGARRQDRGGAGHRGRGRRRAGAQARGRARRDRQAGGHRGHRRQRSTRRCSAAVSGAQSGGAPASDKQIKRALKRARSQGADDALREDIAMRKAVDLVVEHAKAIPVEQAKARDKLWTPGKDEAEAAEPGEIWTPGS